MAIRNKFGVSIRMNNLMYLLVMSDFNLLGLGFQAETLCWNSVVVNCKQAQSAVNKK